MVYKFQSTRCGQFDKIAKILGVEINDLLITD